MPALLIIDGLLAFLLVALGWTTLQARSPAQSVVLFSIMGLIAALIWARLDAPDVALAEAAIGAGLTGALLFAHLRADAKLR